MPFGMNLNSLNALFNQARRKIEDPKYSPYRLRGDDDPRSYNDPESALFTPPFNPDGGRPPVLPNIAPARPNPILPTGPPGGDMRMAPPPRPGRYAELQEAKEAYLAGPRPGRLKSGLLGALRGFGQGLQTGGGLGAGLGGAVAGAGFGALHPRGAMEMDFAERIKPRILERFAIEDQERAGQMSAEDRQLANEERRARIANMNRQNLPQPPRPQAPLRGRPGDVFLNPETGQPMAQIPEQPRAPEQRLVSPAGYRTFDWNDPQQRAAYEQWEQRLPRDARGRFISRSDERVTARGSGGGATSRREEQDAQRQTGQAAAGVANIEKLAREAMESDEAKRPAIFNQMRALANNLQSQFPDLVETGESGGWPFARLRRRGQPAARQTSKSDKSDPLGIR